MKVKMKTNIQHMNHNDSKITLVLVNYSAIILNTTLLYIFISCAFN